MFNPENYESDTEMIYVDSDNRHHKVKVADQALLVDSGYDSTHGAVVVHSFKESQTQNFIAVHYTNLLRE